MASEDVYDRFASKVEVSKEVQKLYSVIQKRSGAVGGYGHNGPIYGEITMGTFQKILNFLRDSLDFTSDSAFLDIGSGLGKPSLHAAVDPGCRLSFGLEVEELRWQLSMHNLRSVIKEVNSFPSKVVHFAHQDVTVIKSLAPFSHIYMFDVGFPPYVLNKIANAFNSSSSVKALVSFQKPQHMIDRYGFKVECIGKVATRMHGSSESHSAYVYRPLSAPSIWTLDWSPIESNTTAALEAGYSSPKKRAKRSGDGLDQDVPVKEFVSPVKRLPRSPVTNSKKPPKNQPLIDPVLQLGLEALSSDAAYSKWADCSGLMGQPGEHKVKRSAKRVLFSPS